MPILDNKSVQELGDEEKEPTTIMLKSLGRRTRWYWFILMMCFFFAGDVIVFLPYHYIRFQWAVLALGVHSLVGVLMVRTNMERKIQMRNIEKGIKAI